MMRPMFRTLILTFAALTFGIITAPEAQAERIPVRAEQSGKSSLITFAWQVPVAYKQSVEGGRLNVTFSRPVEGNFRAVADALKGVVSDARAGSDGRSVSFRLDKPVKVFAFYTGTAVTIELLEDEQAAAKATPASAQAGDNKDTVEVAVAPLKESRVIASAQQTNSGALPADAPVIRVRTGEHPEYTRIVFDFNDATPYQASNNNGVVTVRFQRPARIELGTLASGAARLIGGARSSFSGDATTVTLAVPPTSTVRDFLSGTKVVVDVRNPSGNEEPVALPAQTETAAAPAAPAPQASDANEGAPAAQPVAPVETVQTAPPAPAQPEAPAAAAAGAPVSLTAERTQDAAESSAEAGRPRAFTPSGTPAPSSEPAQSAASEPISEELSPRAQTPAGGLQATDARVTATPGQDQLAFRFDFDEPVAAATFRRGGAIWIVFDKPLNVDTAALQLQAGEGAFEILQIPNETATVLRIRTSQRYNPAVARDGLAWIIDFAARPMAPQTALEINAQPDSPVGARIFVPVPEPGRPVAVADPNIGDNFVVVPVIPLGQSIGRKFTYPQFSIQMAAQGIVINPTIDDLRIRSLRQGVEIGSSGVQLAISNVSDDAAAHAQLAASRAMVVALQELDKYFATTEQFRVYRRRYEAAVADAPKTGKTAARLELAKFFFANAYAPEALGVVRVAIDNIPLLENDPSVRILRGGSNFLLGRYEMALEDLTHESLADNDEGRLWAAAAHAMMGDRIGSARDLRFTGSIARDYPRALKMPLGILIAEVSAETGDGQGARLFLDALNLENPTPGEQAMLKYAEGKLMELDGDFDGAITLWEEVLESDHRPSRARARVARTEMLLKLRRIDMRQAIEEYEKLRFAWRGDKMEFDNLRRLGSLYLDEGFYREGLSTLKEAATHFRDYAEAPDVTKQMSDTFNTLFLGNQSDEIDPVKAIAIYNEFKELTPAGARGDEMIRNLADKLVEVDLLDRAAEILKAQVQFRLEGEQKARVGARLALIYTLAEEFQLGLEVLDGTNGPNIPEELTVQRRHLRAQILSGLKRDGDALALLEDDESENAELLRMEIYWKQADWREAAKSLRLLVKLSGAKPDEPVNETQATRLINYAIALTNAGGERAVSQIKREYGPAMAQTKFAEAFGLVTAPGVVGTLDPGRVTAKVQEAETFLTAYRDKLKEGVPLSSLN
jgi:tetratricopeptide (TPR) repeat protein